MDVDDALPPAIRRSPRATLEAQKTREFRTFVFDESDEEIDDTTPPPIAQSRPTSLIDRELSREPASRPVSSSSSVNSLKARPVNAPPPKNPARQFSRPFSYIQPLDVPSPDLTPAFPSEPPPASRRHPRGLSSYRNNKRELSQIKRLPPHLRRQTSLETINSVNTTGSDDASEYDHDPPEVEAPSPDWFTLEDNPPSNPPPSVRSKPSSTFSSSGSSRQSTIATPIETPLEFASLDHHTPQSLFRKMMPRRMTNNSLEPPPSPTRLVIEKSTSIDRKSQPSTLSRSTTSLQASSTKSLPEEQRFIQSMLGTLERNRPGSKSSGSSTWSASNFDISTLTETEIKKCKKKGINPALYAEMRAAKKGKWTSPIAGNTFL
jgi:hypothetical protein